MVLALNRVSIARGGDPILADVDFNFEFGKVYKLAGKSGVGKSSLFHFLLQDINPLAGNVTYNRTDRCLNDDLDLLENDTGFLAQTPFLFAGSIKNNICFGKDVSNSDLTAALANAEILDELFETRSEGSVFDFKVQSRGQNLSGGQSQRLCLARAFLYKQKRVWLFDEAFSAIDEIRAQRIFQRFVEVNRSALIIYTAHSPIFDSITDVEVNLEKYSTQKNQEFCL